MGSHWGGGLSPGAWLSVDGVGKIQTGVGIGWFIVAILNDAT